ncbi:exopolyphosphatase/guanosine-5'-triphosphate,3'-diphosphate pyrophosphatase [Hasllibacter halocynthiae]|uniref:Exopolyphosphatase/guanosine-5'-triphosphate, 3'-diphosphate pyrophosphatase n=1 Tax=Hasllibacter halocynthiae TaxID=595589 RepID=A0A2T0X6E5_9RHOB|nr:Ppx/GppA family phosphatase [Hasllibacter halocynthiae]PRY94497.1 exopolyphosphatase/guanosine-5'-triphosphate,3'-diphosphate pyrophosphatase [Hasllibacter halocynthiae]
MNDESAADWGPFGRPIFESPEARALSRVGVVDVGSNSVRLVVFDGAARSPAYFYNEKVMAGLGRDMSETGRLHPEGRSRALDALRRFALVGDAMGIRPLSAVATAAVRDAEDGPEFRAEVERATGLKLWVIDGREEARLSAQGVLLGWPGASGLVCDIGGSSMELAELKKGRVGARETSDLGPLKLLGCRSKKDRKAAISKGIARLAAQVGGKKQPLTLVGGSWRAIAKLDMLRRDYPLHVLHEYRMTVKEAKETIRWIAENDLSDLKARSGLSESRISLVPLAGEVLKAVLNEWRPPEIRVSAYGIREGMLYEQMPRAIRERDPLIEACRFSEAKDARLPGFGRTLYRFVRPIWRSARPETRRLIRAACLLHDVTWRAHPDYRAELCFDNATRANLGGLTHPERVFLGLALMHRYKNSRDDERFGKVLSLLPEDRVREAERVGKAMRFGAMLSVSDPGTMGELRWAPKKRVLEFRMDRATAGLFGEVADARLRALGASLEAEVVVKGAS